MSLGWWEIMEISTSESESQPSCRLTLSFLWFPSLAFFESSLSVLSLYSLAPSKISLICLCVGVAELGPDAMGRFSESSLPLSWEGAV